MFGMSAEQERLLREIFTKHIPGTEVWIFGSRVKGPIKRSSDLDVALYGSGPLGLQTIALLEDSLREAPLPFRVDCVDIHTVDEAFRRVIEHQRVRFL